MPGSRMKPVLAGSLGLVALACVAAAVAGGVAARMRADDGSREFAAVERAQARARSVVEHIERGELPGLERARLALEGVVYDPAALDAIDVPGYAGALVVSLEERTNTRIL